MISWYKLLLISLLLLLPSIHASTLLLLETETDPLEIKVSSIKQLLCIKNEQNPNMEYLKGRYNTELYRYVSVLHKESVSSKNGILSIDKNLLIQYSNDYETYLIQKFKLRSKPMLFNFKLYDASLFQSAAKKIDSTSKDGAVEIDDTEDNEEEDELDERVELLQNQIEDLKSLLKKSLVKSKERVGKEIDLEVAKFKNSNFLSTIDDESKKQLETLVKEHENKIKNLKEEGGIRLSDLQHKLLYELNDTKKAALDSLEAETSKHKPLLDKLKEDSKNEIDSLKLDYSNKLKKLKDESAKEISELKKTMNSKLTDENIKSIESKENKLRSHISELDHELQSSFRAVKKSYSKKLNEYKEKLSDAKSSIKAEYKDKILAKRKELAEKYSVVKDQLDTAAVNVEEDLTELLESKVKENEDALHLVKSDIKNKIKLDNANDINNSKTKELLVKEFEDSESKKLAARRQELLAKLKSQAKEKIDAMKTELEYKFKSLQVEIESSEDESEEELSNLKSLTSKLKASIAKNKKLEGDLKEADDKFIKDLKKARESLELKLKSLNPADKDYNDRLTECHSLYDDILNLSNRSDNNLKVDFLLALKNQHKNLMGLNLNLQNLPEKASSSLANSLKSVEEEIIKKIECAESSNSDDSICDDNLSTTISFALFIPYKEQKKIANVDKVAHNLRHKKVIPSDAPTTKPKSELKNDPILSKDDIEIDSEVSPIETKSVPNENTENHIYEAQDDIVEGNISVDNSGILKSLNSQNDKDASSKTDPLDVITDDNSSDKSASNSLSKDNQSESNLMYHVKEYPTAFPNPLYLTSKPDPAPPTHPPLPSDVIRFSASARKADQRNALSLSMSGSLPTHVEESIVKDDDISGPIPFVKIDLPRKLESPKVLSLNFDTAINPVVASSNPSFKNDKGPIHPITKKMLHGLPDADPKKSYEIGTKYGICIVNVEEPCDDELECYKGFCVPSDDANEVLSNEIVLLKEVLESLLHSSTAGSTKVLRARLDFQKKSLANRKNDKINLNSRIKHLIELIEASESKITSSRKNLIESLDEVYDSQVNLKVSETASATYSSKLVEANKSSKSLTKKYDTLVKRGNTRAKKFNIIQEKVNDLKSSILLLKKEIVEKQEISDKLKVLLDKLLANDSKRRSSIKDLRTMIKVNKEKLNSVNGMLAAEKHKSTILTINLPKVHNVYGNLKEKLSHFDKTLGSDRKLVLEKLSTQIEIVTKSMKSNYELLNSYKISEDPILKSVSHISELEFELEEYENALEIHENGLKTANKGLEELLYLLKRIKTLPKELSSKFKAKKEFFETILSKENVAIEGMKKKIDDVNHEIEGVRSKLSDIEKKSVEQNELNSKLHSDKLHLDILKAKLKSLKDDAVFFKIAKQND